MQVMNWIGAHWQPLLGWLTGLVTLYKTGRFFAKVAISVNNFFESFVKSRETLELLATNHLPHLQVEMEKMNEGLADLQISTDGNAELLTGIREDLRAVLDRI